jgi:ferrous iron transport protein A
MMYPSAVPTDLQVTDIMTLAPTLTTLDALKAGQSGTVIHLAPGSGGDGIDVPRRLMELGFVPGERIRMLKRGLPGGPVAVKVGQSTFALRRFEAALVSIRPE